MPKYNNDREGNVVFNFVLLNDSLVERLELEKTECYSFSETKF